MFEFTKYILPPQRSVCTGPEYNFRAFGSLSEMKTLANHTLEWLQKKGENYQLKILNQSRFALFSSPY